jgi:hypothetical protein
MTRKPIELPLGSGQKFVADMRAYFVAETELQRDEIAARQLHHLSQHLRSGDKKLRLSDVRKMFELLRDEMDGQ